jgi:hypothetical protein
MGFGKTASEAWQAKQGLSDPLWEKMGFAHI